MDFNLVLLVSAAMKLLYALAAVTLMWWTIRFINKSVGVNVRIAVAKIASDPVALAIYRAGIFLATAIVIAQAIG